MNEKNISRSRRYVRADNNDERIIKFASRMIFERKKNNAKQMDFAALLGITQPHLSLIETGQIEPSPLMVFDFERILHLESGALSKHLGYVQWISTND